MRKIFTPLFLLFFVIQGNAQKILDIPTIIQTESNWCWAATTCSILNYYGHTKLTQCEIANYTRTVATFHNFGKEDCCVNPKAGCDYWNYNWGSAGSIEDIFKHFGKIEEKNVNSSLSFATIKSEIDASRPFIIRWGWLGGGGHFIVCKGYSETHATENTYYMNPLKGEGAKVSKYSWLKSGSNHTWTHTNQLTTSPVASGVVMDKYSQTIKIVPNPASSIIRIEGIPHTGSVELITTLGQSVYKGEKVNTIDLDGLNLTKGVYVVKVTEDNHNYFKKVIIE